MKLRITLRIILLALALLVAASIFGFSSEDADDSSQTSGSIIEKVASIFVPGFDKMSSAQKEEIISSAQNFVRKTAHFCIYTLLGGLLAGAVLTHINVHKIKKWLYPLLCCFLYAVSDEIHQSFIPGRSCEVRDMFIDTCGALLGISIVYFAKKLIVKVRTRHS